MAGFERSAMQSGECRLFLTLSGKGIFLRGQRRKTFASCRMFAKTESSLGESFSPSV